MKYIKEKIKNYRNTSDAKEIYFVSQLCKIYLKE